MSKNRAKGELGPFSRTSAHQRLDGCAIENQAHAAGAKPMREFNQLLLAADLRIDHAVVGNIVTVEAAGARKRQRRRIAIGYSEISEVVD
jgi:hypothetical protein